MTRLEQVRKEMTAARSANLDRVSAMLAGSGLSEGAQAAVRVVLDETNTTFAVGVITIMTGVDKEERRATLALAARALAQFSADAVVDVQRMLDLIGTPS